MSKTQHLDEQLATKSRFERIIDLDSDYVLSVLKKKNDDPHTPLLNLSLHQHLLGCNLRPY